MLPLRIGHTYTLRDQICKRRHLVTGAEVTLVHIVGLQRTGTSTVAVDMERTAGARRQAGQASESGEDHAAQIDVRVSAIEMPTMLLPQSPGATWQGPEGREPGVFPLVPRRVDSLEVSHSIWDVPFARRQFMIIPSDSSTTHGAQGMSLDTVVADIRVWPRMSVSDGQYFQLCYVALG